MQVYETFTGVVRIYSMKRLPKLVTSPACPEHIRRAQDKLRRMAGHGSPTS
jgi:hypothetical protein